MRILYVITRSNRGGAQTNLLALAHAAQKAGYHVSVVTGEIGWLTRELDKLHISVHLFRSLRRSWNPLNILGFIGELRHHLAKQPADVVHCHSSNTMPAVWATRSLGSNRPRAVFTVHGWSALSPGWKESGYFYWLYRMAVKTFLPVFDRVILVSQADLDLTKKHQLLPTQHISLVRNGIAPNRFLRDREEARKVLFALIGQADNGQPVIGTVARLDYAKNLAMLVEAAHQVPDSKILYIIGGDGPEQPVLRRQIENYGLNQQVRLIGPVIDTGDFLAAFDLFVMPSRFEGLPYALLEAGLAERPVVATPVGGIPEIIEHGFTGRLLPENNVTALTKEIDWFLRHRPEATRLGQNLKRQVLERFNQHEMTEQTLKLYV